MEEKTHTALAALRLSPESSRVIEANIAAGTTGMGLRLLVTMIAVGTTLVIAFALGVAANALIGSGGAGDLQKAGFALAIAVPFAISLVFQVQFVRRLGGR